MKKIVLFLLLVNMSVMLSGQHASTSAMFSGQHDYIKTDSNMVVVELLYDDDLTNSKYCQVIKYDAVTRYSPYDLTMYVFKDGRAYVSKELQFGDSTKRVFLERLVDGRTSLYYLKEENGETFFLEKDSTYFKPIPNGEGKNNTTLTSYLQEVSSPCPMIRDAANSIIYKKKYLTKFFKAYNECEPLSVPYFKYGINIGVEAAGLYAPSGFVPEYINEIDFKEESVLTFGAFIDYPINLSKYSLHTELMYRQFDFLYTGQTEFEDMDFTGKVATLKLPVLLRYTHPFPKFKPFVNAGFMVAFNIKNESAMYLSSKDLNAIETGNIIETTLIEKNLWGLAFGGGVEYKLSRKNSLFLEVRYSNFTEILKSNTLKYSDMILVTGFSF